MRNASIALLATLFPFLVAAPVLAEEPPLKQQSFGMVAGRLGGLGFTYRSFAENGWGMGVGGIVLGNSASLSGNLSLQGYRTLHRTATGRLYALAGVAMFAGFADAFAVGAGPGIEIGGGFGPALSLEVPVTYATSQGLVMIPTLALLYGF